MRLVFNHKIAAVYFRDRCISNIHQYNSRVSLTENW